MEVFWRIKGRVQRVGFRRWASAKATQLGNIGGYVCNAENGDVLIAADGEEHKIYNFMQACFKGPLFARVDAIDSNPDLKQFFPPIEKGVFKVIR